MHGRTQRKIGLNNFQIFAALRLTHQIRIEANILTRTHFQSQAFFSRSFVTEFFAPFETNTRNNKYVRTDSILPWFLLLWKQINQKQLNSLDWAQAKCFSIKFQARFWELYASRTAFWLRKEKWIMAASCIHTKESQARLTAMDDNSARERTTSFFSFYFVLCAVRIAI